MCRVSAIVPARNEEANIGPCVASLLAQDADLEVLVSDDGSTDRTAAIVEDLARSDRRVRLIRAPALPPGWTGKNHAISVAAREAAGDWLLLTDADTRHLPGGLAKSLQRAESCALYSVSPEQEVVTWWEKAVIPRVYRELERLYSYDEINRPESAAAAANGQYILIRRRVYEDLGGHAALSGEILEDVALARKVKTSGRRIWFGSGAGIVRTRMYSTFRAMWEGWTKNLCLLYGKNAGRMWAAVLRTALRNPLYAALLLNSMRHHRQGQTVAWKGREYTSWST
jgi:glycosyltransferase involved in cell wall biosynthesis